MEASPSCRRRRGQAKEEGILTTTWTNDELRRRGGPRRCARLRALGRHAGSYVTMWAVRAGDDLYVRSAYGPTNPWFRRAKASGTGRIRAGGPERDVTFGEPVPEVHAVIDAADRAKYDRYGPRIVGSVVGPQAESVTIRLVARAS